MKNEYYILNNNYQIPTLGFGTFRTKPGEETEQSVINAIKAGYRHIDAAAAYGNEKSVGEAIRKSGFPREDLFITSKLWNDNKGYDQTIEAFNNTLEDLGLDYLDLYLIHWPIASASKDNWEAANAESWRAMEDLYKSGKIKAIGVSNFLVHHLDALMKDATIMPMVNQLELHPSHMQEAAVKFSQEHGMLVEAWAPFSNGEIFKNDSLKEIAAHYNVGVAQLTLRWLLDQGILPISKSITPERIQKNLDVYSFEITTEDSNKIKNIKGIEGSGLNPDEVDF